MEIAKNIYQTLAFERIVTDTSRLVHEALDPNDKKTSKYIDELLYSSATLMHLAKIKYHDFSVLDLDPGTHLRQIYSPGEAEKVWDELEQMCLEIYSRYQSEIET